MPVNWMYKMVVGLCVLSAWPSLAEDKDKSELAQVERTLITNRSEVELLEVLDEMLDELAVSIAQLEPSKVGPILIDRIVLSQNLNPQAAGIVEARLIQALTRASKVTLIRCSECSTTRSRMEQGKWVVTQGLQSREEWAKIGRTYQARTRLTVVLTVQSEKDTMSLDATLTRLEDGVVAYADGFRFQAGSALLYGMGEVNKRRDDRLRDLKARIDAPPQYGHSALFGYMSVPSVNVGDIPGGFFGYRLHESFGEDRENRVWVLAGGFINTTQLSGGLLGLGLGRRVTGANVFAASLHLGGQLGYFITGTAGNTPVATFHSELLLVHRIAIQGSLHYLVPFEMTKIGKVGGFCPQFGVGFVW